MVQRGGEGRDVAEGPGPMGGTEKRLAMPGVCLVSVVLLATLEARVQSVSAADP